MRHLFVSLLAFGVLGLATAAAEEPAALDAFVEDSRAMVKDFAQNLKGELQAAIKTGGPIHAISVCNVRAPQIAGDAARSPAWTIGRTSYRVRNPDNAHHDDMSAAERSVVRRPKARSG